MTLSDILFLSMTFTALVALLVAWVAMRVSEDADQELRTVKADNRRLLGELKELRSNDHRDIEQLVDEMKHRVDMAVYRQRFGQQDHRFVIEPTADGGYT